jgi:long-subunit fatty acid transport protein
MQVQVQVQVSVHVHLPMSVSVRVRVRVRVRVSLHVRADWRTWRMLTCVRAGSRLGLGPPHWAAVCWPPPPRVHGA